MSQNQHSITQSITQPNTQLDTQLSTQSNSQLSTQNLKILGFDIGVASIGWALVQDGGTRDSRKIIDCGVRIFESVGESHKERGEKRRARRNVERTKSRLNNIKRYLFENFIKPQGEFSDFNEWQKALFAKENLPNPYVLRIKALENTISTDELCQIIIHIVKHRAYNDSGKEYEAENILEIQDENQEESQNSKKKSSDKDDKKDKKEDKKKLKAAMKENAQKALNSPSFTAYIYDRQVDMAKQNAQIKYQTLLEKFKKESKYESIRKLEAKKDEWIRKIAEHSIKMRNGLVTRINKNGKEVEEQSHINSFPRSAIKAELTKILDTQIRESKQSNDYAQKLENLKSMLFAENDDGLGFLQNRPLKSSKDLLGKCTIDERENRASAFAPSVIEFNLLAKLSNLLTYLIAQHKELQIDYAKTSSEARIALKEKCELKFSDIRKCIYLADGQSIADNYEINILGFNKKERKEDKAKSTKKNQKSNEKDEQIKKDKTQENNTTFYNPSKKLALLEHTFGKETLWKFQRDIDILAGILSVNKRKKDIQKEIDECKDCKDIDENLKAKALDSLGAGFSGTSAYCLNVVWSCLESMRLGVSEYEATYTYKANLNEDKAYKEYMQKYEKSLTLPAFAENPNASLNRICAQMREITNAIFAKYGAVAKIRIELLREVGQSEKQRAEIQKAQRENEKFNECARQICEEIGLSINKDNLIKVKLWILQNEADIYPSAQKGKDNAKEVLSNAKECIDVYDSFKKISLQDLRDENALQIDHIIPRSKSLDDSFTNKVLTFAGNNATKSSRIPYQWFGNDKAKWEAFKARVNATKLSKKAKDNLLKQEVEELKPSKWLNDTKTAAVYIRNYLEKYVAFADISSDLQDSEERESKQIRRIEVVNGRLTSMLRHYWGIGKKDRNNHLHHAQDAVAIAFCGSRIIQNFAKFLQIQEDKSQKKLNSEEITEIIKQTNKGRQVFVRPFSGFVNDLHKRIYGDENSEGIFVTYSKKHRATGKLHNENPLRIKDNLNKGDKEELAKRLQNAQSEILERIEKEKATLGRMLTGEEYGKIKSKFEHPIRERFYEEVKQRQIANNVWIEIKGHIYEIDGMTRIDIFYTKMPNDDEERYYAVPVFITDRELSNIAKPDNCELDDKDFLFSLHNGDLVEFQHKGITRYGYYRGFRQNGQIMLYHHSGFLSKQEKEENFWNDTTNEKGEVKPQFPQKLIKINQFASLKLCQINALGDRQTLIAKDNKRERGKAPLSDTMGRKNKKSNKDSQNV